MLTFCRHARAVVCLGGLCLIAVMSFSDQSARSADPPPVGPRGTSVLVLRNGRIISGRISEGAGGYMVHKANGSVLVPFDRIHLRATDVRDAYRRLRESVKVPSATTHIGLANWCLTQQLYDETRAELRSALEIEPNRTEARNMLRRLEEILNPRGAVHRESERAARKTGDGFSPAETSSLGGLSRAAARQFVTKIQPLMMNNCAIAGCHGSRATNAFRLSRVRAGTGNSRVLTEHNLAAVLAYVDSRDPDRSRLLRVPRGNHGRRGRAVFSGRRSSAQFNLLKSWVRLVAGENESTTDKLTSSTAQGRSTVFANKQPVPAWANLRPRSYPENNPPRSAAAGDPLLRAILREERPDAFDPAKFNRQTLK